MINSLKSVLTEALDKHAPATTKTLTTWKSNPWFTEEIRTQKRILRKMERVYHRYKTNTSWQNFRIQKQNYRDMLKKAKTEAVSEKVAECSNDTKKLHKIVNNILGTTNEKPLPPSDYKNKLADEFANYFIEKTPKIREQLDSYDKYMPWHKEIPTLSQFDPMTTEEVTRLKSSMATKSCKLDAIPTSVLKQITWSIVHTVTKIINISLTQGIFTEEWKTAIVHPLLKKLGSELTPSNYRPVSNLSFLSKLLEKYALQQFNNHCITNKLLPDYQLAYRKNYSMETSLIKLISDISWAVERQQVTALTALDLSAAFNTVDHEILIEVLEHQFGITNLALSWFKTYLYPRKFVVNIDGHHSREIDLKFSVPQGSLAGPILYLA